MLFRHFTHKRKKTYNYKTSMIKINSNRNSVKKKV